MTEPLTTHCSPGSGAIHVKDLTCDSSQSCFTDCFEPHVLIHDCNHTMDVAIQCRKCTQLGIEDFNMMSLCLQNLT